MEFIYHIYPLGLLGCPERNEGLPPARGKMLGLAPWIDHAAELGADAVWFGPVFESTTHGYDTLDYYRVDPRLGTNDDLKELVSHSHRLGVSVILDAVFNHTGIQHPRFREMVELRRAPDGGSWYDGVDFSRNGPNGVPFAYEGWSGCMDLAKLDLRNPSVRSYVIDAALYWIHEFGVDGLRLDAADCLDHSFMQDLANRCKHAKPGFWIMAEAVHGDYGKYIRDDGLDSVTNYECRKGLYSSFNDKNMHEIAYSLKRQFSEGGIYEGMRLYNFADNHDVDRIASALVNPAHLHPLHVLLFTMPGLPSVYYGSEWGIAGKRDDRSDRDLRPRIELSSARETDAGKGLVSTIKRLSALRNASPALKEGAYRESRVSKYALAFIREKNGERVLAAINASTEWISIDAEVPGAKAARDLLDFGLPHPTVVDGSVRISIPPCWGRILAV